MRIKMMPSIVIATIAVVERWTRTPCNNVVAQQTTACVVEDIDAYYQSGTAYKNTTYPHGGEGEGNTAYCHASAAKDDVT